MNMYTFSSFKGNKEPHIYFPAIWFSVHGQMTEEGSSGLELVMKLPLMFYISTLTSMGCTLLLILICAFRNLRRQSVKNRGEFTSVSSSERGSGNTSKSTSNEDISVKDPSEKELFVTVSPIIKNNEENLLNLL